MHASLSRLDASGNYVADVTGSKTKRVEIPAAVTENACCNVLGERPAFGNSLNRKAESLVADQMRRFPDLRSYPCTLSDGLTSCVMT